MSFVIKKVNIDFKILREERVKASILSLALLMLSANGFAMTGTIVDHRVIQSAEVDGTQVPGKIALTEEECEAMARSQGYSSGKVITATQALTEAEMSIQESLTGRQVVSRTVNFCLAN